MTLKNVYKRSDGRWVAYCTDENGKPHIKSYPWILMEQKLGRPLKPNEDVHHKDEDIDNNDPSNLEIKIHGEHQREHSIKYVDTKEVCIICGAEFTMTHAMWARFYGDLHRMIPRERTLTCSRSCGAKYGSKVYKPLYSLESRLKEVESFWKK